MEKLEKERKGEGTAWVKGTGNYGV